MGLVTDDDDEPTDRRGNDRRKADKWRRRIDRGFLLLAFVLIFIGFRSLEGKQHQIDSQAAGATQNRVAVARELCVTLNEIIDAVNGQSTYIQGLIVGGTKSSRPFERSLRQLGFPPYRERLRQARLQAAGLKMLAVHHVGCVALQRKIEIGE